MWQGCWCRFMESTDWRAERFLLSSLVWNASGWRTNLFTVFQGPSAWTETCSTVALWGLDPDTSANPSSFLTCMIYLYGPLRRLSEDHLNHHFCGINVGSMHFKLGFWWIFLWQFGMKQVKRICLSLRGFLKASPQKRINLQRSFTLQSVLICASMFFISMTGRENSLRPSRSTLQLYLDPKIDQNFTFTKTFSRDKINL